jgi:hypothetical protein
MEELNSVERSFSDLHRRYEKTKLLIEGFKKNEGTAMISQTLSGY